MSRQRVINAVDASAKVYDDTGTRSAQAMPVIIVNQAGRPMHPPGDGTGYAEFFKDSLGSRDMSVNGSVTEQEFFVEAPTGFVVEIDKIAFLVQDTSMAGGDFGGFGGGLTNGVGLDLRFGNITTGILILDLVAGFRIKTNIEWGIHVGEFPTWDLGTLKGLAMEFDFSRTIRQPVRLTGARTGQPAAMRLSVRIKDNLTGRANFKFWAKATGSQYAE